MENKIMQLFMEKVKFQGTMTFSLFCLKNLEMHR